MIELQEQVHVVVAMEDTDLLLAIEEAWQCLVVVGVLVAVIILEELLCCAR